MRHPSRVLVHGVTGSGKSVMAARIGCVLGLPVHLVDDEIGWLPGWVGRSEAEQRDIVRRLVAEPAWVLDSAYGSWLDLVLPRVDLVVGLDYRRAVSLTRLLRRTGRRLVTRERVCNGNVESWRQVVSRDSILVWHFRAFARKRRRIRGWAADADRRRATGAAGPQVVHLRSPRHTEAWLAGLAAGQDVTKGTPKRPRWATSSRPRRPRRRLGERRSGAG